LAVFIQAGQAEVALLQWWQWRSCIYEAGTLGHLHITGCTQQHYLCRYWIVDVHTTYVDCM